MKKNFLKVAALLIAAMLMVVSCTQEVAPVDNGLVEASISVGYGRDLTVSGDTNTSNITLYYTMKPLWKNAEGTTEGIYGTKESETPFSDNVSIGYVTPGLWEVKVYAYETAKDESATDATKKIFEGTANAYFSSQKKSVKVYLSPVSNQKNTLSFSIVMQDLVGTLGESGTGSYKLCYSVYGTGDTVVKNYDNSASLNDVELTNKAYSDTNNDGKNDTTTYSGSVDLTSGFYRVTVSVYSVDGSNKKLVGGITKGFLLSGEKTASISGHIEPSDYEKVTIDAVYIDVNTSVTATDPSYVAKEDGEDATPAKASVTFSVDTTRTSGDVSGAEVSYIWYVADTEKTKPISSNTKSFTVAFEAPGYKTVTCQTIYTVTVGSVEYKFADTKSCQVYIDADNAVWK